MSSIFHVALCKEAVVDIMISSHCRKKCLGAFPSPTMLGQSTAESKSQIAAYMLQRIVGTSACCQFTGSAAGLVESLLDTLSQATGGENFVDEIKELRYPSPLISSFCTVSEVNL